MCGNHGYHHITSAASASHPGSVYSFCSLDVTGERLQNSDRSVCFGFSGPQCSGSGSSVARFCRLIVLQRKL